MRRSWKAGKLLPIALILAVGLRFLCPPGWMPNPAGVAPPFILCPSEDAPAAAMLAMPRMAMGADTPAPAQDKAHPDHCVPGAWVMGTAAETPILQAPVAFETAVVAEEARPAPRVPPARHRPQAPRAPPLIA